MVSYAIVSTCRLALLGVDAVDAVGRGRTIKQSITTAQAEKVRERCVSVEENVVRSDDDDDDASSRASRRIGEAMDACRSARRGVSMP